MTITRTDTPTYEIVDSDARAKHSPTPWKNGRDANGDVVICQADTATGPERNEEYQANRALFDAAPELLAALLPSEGGTASFPEELEVVAGIIDRYDAGSGLGKHLRQRAERISAAIAKATGGAS